VQYEFGVEMAGMDYNPDGNVLAVAFYYSWDKGEIEHPNDRLCCGWHPNRPERTPKGTPVEIIQNAIWSALKFPIFLKIFKRTCADLDIDFRNVNQTRRSRSMAHQFILSYWQDFRIGRIRLSSFYCHTPALSGCLLPWSTRNKRNGSIWRIVI
jgi:hypothetical protein